MSTDQRGLGSDNMDEKTKQEVRSKGGKASHSGGTSSQKGDVTTNKAGGGALNTEAQRKGGRSSHRS